MLIPSGNLGLTLGSDSWGRNAFLLQTPPEVLSGEVQAKDLLALQHEAADATADASNSDPCVERSAGAGSSGVGAAARAKAGTWVVEASAAGAGGAALGGGTSIRCGQMLLAVDGETCVNMSFQRIAGLLERSAQRKRKLVVSDDMCAASCYKRVGESTHQCVLLGFTWCAV